MGAAECCEAFSRLGAHHCYLSLWPQRKPFQKLQSTLGNFRVAFALIWLHDIEYGVCCCRKLEMSLKSDVITLDHLETDRQASAKHEIC